MSYILDALRKADAQRERDPARGIHAQAQRPMGTPAGPRGARSPAIWGPGAAALAILAAAGWYFYSGRNASLPDRSARTELAANGAKSMGTVGNAASPAPVVGVTPLPAPLVQAAPAVATRIEPPAPAIRQVQLPERDPRATSQPPMRGNLHTTPGVAPQQDVNTSPPPPNAAASAATTGVPVPPTPPRPAVPPVGAPPAAAAPATPAVAGLPPDAPKLAISGGVYSGNRAQRMLIVNGQVFNEGSEIGPGVVLEEIKAKTALLRFRGARYTVGY